MFDDRHDYLKLAIWFSVVLFAGSWLMAVWDWAPLRGLWLCLLAVLGFSTLYELALNARERLSDLYQGEQNARHETAEVRFAKACATLNPRTVELITAKRLRTLALVAGRVSPTSKPYAVLAEEPEIPVAFVLFVLENSNGAGLMPKYGRIVEGRKSRWDPRGVMAENEMYDRVVALFVDYGYVTRGHGNTPPFWTGGWSAQRVADDLLDAQIWDPSLEPAAEEKEAGLVPL